MIQTPAVLGPFLGRWETTVSAPVLQDCLEIRTLSASQNAPSTLSVLSTKPVSDRNVWILALVFVEPTLDVQFKITILAVHVIQDIPEIPSDSAPELQPNESLLKLSTPVHRHLVDPMLSVMKEAEQQHASVYQTTLEIPT